MQYAASRGIPAFAVSARVSTEGEADKSGNRADNPLSLIIADHVVTLLNEIARKAERNPILPANMGLNVNCPEAITSSTAWSFSRIGSYNQCVSFFTEDLSKNPLASGSGLKTAVYPGISLTFNNKKPSADQLEDESVVYKTKIVVSAMQVA